MAPTDAAPPMLERRSVRNFHAVSLRMPPSPCGSWEATRRELGEYAYGVLSIDAIAVILGGLGSRHLGSGMWLAGLGLAAYVTLCFTLLIVGNLAIECLAGWWLGWLAHRRSRRPRRRYYWLRRRV